MRFVLPFFFVLIPVTMRAQVDTAARVDSLAVTRGAEVRVTTRVGRVIRGRLAASDSDSIRVRMATTSDRWIVAAIPRDSIASVEINHPGSTQLLKGAATGTGVGFAIGLAAYVPITLCILCNDQEVRAKSDNARRVIDIAVLAGGVLGALIGSGTREERWTPVAVQRVAIGPRGPSRGVGLGLALRF